MITNGDFATDSDWVKQTGWTIGDGVAKVDNTSTDYISQDGIVSDTKTYAITFTILNYISGSIRLRLGNTYGDYVSGNGTYTKYIQCTTSNKFRVYSSPSGANLSIDNVSVKEVGQDWTLLNGSISDKYNASMTAYQSGIKITPFSKTGKYKAVFDLVVTSGSCKFDAGGGNDEIYTTSGTKEKLITNPTKFEFNAFNLGWVGTLDNISVKEITDDTDLPRIDYTDGCGSWLLEPQSTNLVTQSELFSDSSWAKSDVTAEGGFTSPSGDESAYKLKEGSATINHQMFGIISGTAGNIYTLSGIFKKGERDIIQLVYGAAAFDEGNIYCNFDLSNGVLGSGLYLSASITLISNGWYRCELTATKTITGNFNISYAPKLTSTASRNASYTGDGTSGVYIWGAQLEQQSYATSYIPTNGAIATRLADEATNSGNSTLINSTEGVLYAEIAALADDLTERRLTISDGSSSNRVAIEYTLSSNQIKGRVVSSGSTSANINFNTSSILDFNKIAISYKQNDFNLWFNGVKVGTDTSGNTPTGLSKLSFDSGTGGNKFNGKVKAVAVYKEALTDAQLQSLTTQ